MKIYMLMGGAKLNLCRYIDADKIKIYMLMGGAKLNLYMPLI
jgi:hypothetical protein